MTIDCWWCHNDQTVRYQFYSQWYSRPVMWEQVLLDCVIRYWTVVYFMGFNIYVPLGQDESDIGLLDICCRHRVQLGQWPSMCVQGKLQCWACAQHWSFPWTHWKSMLLLMPQRTGDILWDLCELCFSCSYHFHYKAWTLLFSNIWSRISDSVNFYQVVKMSIGNLIQSRYVSLNWYELNPGRAVNLVANIDDIKLGQLLLSQGPYILRYQCYVETFMFLVVYNQCFHCYTVFH